MAVVNVKSTQITNRDALPRVINNPRVTSGVKQMAIDTAVITSGDSVGSTYRIAQVPSRALVAAIRVSAPDIGPTTAADIGVYRTTLDGGAVVSAASFASAIVLNAGAINKSDVTFESGTYTLANGAKPLWEALGLTADPGVDYDIALTLTGAADATGTALVEIEYVL